MEEKIEKLAKLHKEITEVRNHLKAFEEIEKQFGELIKENQDLNTEIQSEIYLKEEAQKKAIKIEKEFIEAKQKWKPMEDAMKKIGDKE